ncbi:MAG: HEPN domain-containing protein, partial [bacterium]
MDNKTKIWVCISDKDFEVAESLLKKKYYSYAVFMAHQAVEKMLKAMVQEILDKPPLYTHDFALLIKQTKLEFPENTKKMILRLSPHYFATRYPEDLQKIIKQYNSQFTKKYLKDAE